MVFSSTSSGCRLAEVRWPLQQGDGREMLGGIFQNHRTVRVNDHLPNCGASQQALNDVVVERLTAKSREFFGITRSLEWRIGTMAAIRMEIEKLEIEAFPKNMDRKDKKSGTKNSSG